MTALKGLIAIGASTGGPRALQHVLAKFPPDFPVGVFVVQHMPPKFTRLFADRLDGMCALKVKEAEHDDRVRAGTIYVAPGGRHLTVQQSGSTLYTILDDTVAVSGHRPAVDRLFASLTNIAGIPMALVLLTGMGKDGAEGMRQVKQGQPKVKTLVEAESSCVVFGMPKAAIATGCVDRVVPLTAIADNIKQIVNGWSKEGGTDDE